MSNKLTKDKPNGGEKVKLMRKRKAKCDKDRSEEESNNEEEDEEYNVVW